MNLPGVIAKQYTKYFEELAYDGEGNFTGRKFANIANRVENKRETRSRVTCS